MAARTLWNYLTHRVRTLFRNYNVIERADKQINLEKRRSSPRHPGTQAKFDVLVKGIENVQSEMEKKPEDLLNRLKIVKVTSGDVPQQTTEDPRDLPQNRDLHEMPLFGYMEPKSIPLGRCSLRQALEFITQHQNDPKQHTMQSIASTYKMNEKDVENIITHFRAFRIHLATGGKSAVAKSTLDSLGISKIVQPKSRSQLAHLESPDVKEPKKDN